MVGRTGSACPFFAFFLLLLLHRFRQVEALASARIAGAELQAGAFVAARLADIDGVVDFFDALVDFVEAASAFVVILVVVLVAFLCLVLRRDETRS